MGHLRQAAATAAAGPQVQASLAEGPQPPGQAPAPQLQSPLPPLPPLPWQPLRAGCQASRLAAPAGKLYRLLVQLHLLRLLLGMLGLLHLLLGMLRLLRLPRQQACRLETWVRAAGTPSLPWQPPAGRPLLLLLLLLLLPQAGH
jgi:hypothetical protein